MKTRRVIQVVGGAALAAALVKAFRVSIPKGAKAVTPFDSKKYLGKWYEIARFNYRFEKGLNNVTADYSQEEDGSIKVVNRGFDTKKNEWESVVGKAKFVKSPDVGRLKVSFFGPFYSGYNVLSVDDDYKYALVAGNNRNYLWILSREISITAEIKKKYLDIADELGYDTSRLIWCKHDKQ